MSTLTHSITEDYTPDEIRREQLSRFIVIGLIACTVYMITYILSDLWLLTGILIFTVVFNLILFQLHRKGLIPLRLACHLFLAVVIYLGLVPGIVATGGLTATGLSWLAFPPMIAQMVLPSKKDAYIWLFSCLFVVLVFTYLYFLQIPMPNIYRDPISYMLDTFVTYLGLFYITVVFATSFIERETIARKFLQNTARLLDTSNQVARIGTWELDVNSQVVSWSNTLTQLFDLDPNLNGKKLFETYIIHSDEANKILEEKFDRAIRYGESFDIEVDVRTQNGIFKWMRVYGIPLFQNGECVKVYGVVHDITEKVNHTNFLKQSKELAEYAHKSKSDFIAHVTHEIRSPLNAIIGFSDMLAHSTINEDLKKYTTSIHRASFQLLHLVNAVLDVSKIEAGKFKLQPLPVDFKLLTDKIYQIVSEELTNINVRIDFRIDPQIPRQLLMDAHRFEQVVYQLLRNAIKFTHEGEIVFEIRIIHSTFNQVTLLCSVKDPGIGIDKKSQQHIFNLFGQDSADINSGIAGTGIGLVISKSIVEKMGGELKLKSAPGKGSEFFFEFTVPVVDKSFSKETHKEPEKILLVEDDAVNRMLLELSLKSKYPTAQILTAESGRHAAELLQNTKVDVVITDWIMPEMNGKELVDFIRKDLNDLSVVIIALSGNRIDASEIEGIGLNASMLKPMNIQELDGLIKNALNKL
ncbi:MAG: ATP-binding protein [Cytophagaceae bacterium]